MSNSFTGPSQIVAFLFFTDGVVKTPHHWQARSNLPHNQVDELAVDCFAKLRKAANDELN